uniref:Uncharacterized protein n=1 Tax=Babesia duncani TaxID=323732 RepID=A0A385GNM1_9APIC|nr:hypothetical protein [Babesia duncani]
MTLNLNLKNINSIYGMQNNNSKIVSKYLKNSINVFMYNLIYIINTNTFKSSLVILIIILIKIFNKNKLFNQKFKINATINNFNKYKIIFCICIIISVLNLYINELTLNNLLYIELYFLYIICPAVTRFIAIIVYIVKNMCYKLKKLSHYRGYAYNKIVDYLVDGCFYCLIDCMGSPILRGFELI